MLEKGIETTAMIEMQDREKRNKEKHLSDGKHQSNNIKTVQFLHLHKNKPLKFSNP